MNGQSVIVVLIIAALLGVSTVSALSTVYTPTVTVEAGEHLAQLEAWREAHPEDEHAAVALAKAHCFIYAYNRSGFAVESAYAQGAPPRTLEAQAVPVRSAALRLPVSLERLHHLAEGIALLKGRAAGRMLYGYACREAAARCEEPGWPGERFEMPEGFEQARAYWEAEAFAAFRSMRAERRPVPDEYRMRMDYMPPVEFESLFLYRMLSAKDSRSTEEEAELQDVTEKAREAMMLLHGPVEGDYGPKRELPFTSGGDDRLNLPYPPVPAEENGAEYYLHAADAYMAFDFPHDVRVPFTEWRTGEPGEFDVLSEDSLRVMEEYVASNAESLRLMREATQFAACRYPGYTMGIPGYTFAGTVGAKSLNQVAAVQVALAAHRGEVTEAEEHLIAMTACANSLRGMPDTMAMLTRIGAVSSTLEVLQWLTKEVKLSEQQLIDLQRAVASMEDLQGLRAASGGLDVPSSIPVSREEARQRAIGRKISDINAPANADISATEEEIDAAAEQLQAEMDEALQSINAASAVQEELSQLSLGELYERVRQFGEGRVAFGAPRVDHARDASGRMSLAFLRGIAEVRVAQAAFAVARFHLRTGDYPRNLDLLTPSYLPRSAIEDPFTKGFLQVQRLGNEFTVFSVGYPALTERVSRRGHENAPSGIFFTLEP